jgi:hypothetical protein
VSHDSKPLTYPSTPKPPHGCCRASPAAGSVTARTTSRRAACAVHRAQVDAGTLQWTTEPGETPRELSNQELRWPPPAQASSAHGLLVGLQIRTRRLGLRALRPPGAGALDLRRRAAPATLLRSLPYGCHADWRVPGSMGRSQCLQKAQNGWGRFAPAAGLDKELDGLASMGKVIRMRSGGKRLRALAEDLRRWFQQARARVRRIGRRRPPTTT